MDQTPIVMIDYTNWRGERAWRRIAPVAIHFEKNKWHTDIQWLLEATDIETSQPKMFAMSKIHAWRPLAEVLAEATPLPPLNDSRPKQEF